MLKLIYPKDFQLCTEHG